MGAGARLEPRAFPVAGRAGRRVFCDCACVDPEGAQPSSLCCGTACARHASAVPAGHAVEPETVGSGHRGRGHRTCVGRFIGARCSGIGAAIFDINGLLPLLVSAWIAGVALLLARAVYQWRALDRIATRLAWAQTDIEEMLHSVGALFGRTPRVRVLVSRHIDTPTLIGWFSPVILLPAAVVLGFPRQQLELIIAHELGHLRRYDHLVNLGQAILETLLFYHPVVHWISREVRHEREVCCDNLVLRLTQREPREYARTLAALEDLRQMAPRLAVAASGGFLLDRVRRIVSSTNASPRHEKPAQHFTGWIIAAVVVGGVTLATLASRRDVEAQQAVEFAHPVLSDALRVHAVVAPGIDVDAIPRLEWARLPRLRMPVRATAGVDTQTTDRAVPTFAPESVGDLHDDAVAQPLDVSRSALIGDTDVPMVVTDVSTLQAPAPALPVASAPSRARTAPTLVRRVDPVYPDVNVSGSRGHVEFEFAIDDAGHVRDISVVSGDSLGALAVAARRALRQWRFAPHRAQAHNAERFRQDFVFIGISRSVTSSDDPICLRGTGSNLCRPGREVGVTTEVDFVEPDPIAARDDLPSPARGNPGRPTFPMPAAGADSGTY